APSFSLVHPCRPPPTSTLFPYTTLFRSNVPPDESRSSPPRRDSDETTRRPTSRESQMRTAPPPREDSSSGAGNGPGPPRIPSAAPRPSDARGSAGRVAREKAGAIGPPNDPVSEGQLW